MSERNDREVPLVEEGDGGVGARTVRISISKHLQAFRSAASLATAKKLIPHTTQRLNEASPELPVASCDIISPNNDNVLEEESPVPKQSSVHDVSSKDDEQLETVVSPTQRNENVIRPIDRSVVHQICSGQVIVTLSTAVKELVENSIDAGATKIDIRMVEHGSKLIEVSDDGSGIEEMNFEGLALKHHTSKISEFEDLESISTFGFRGEALSSLCALSNLTVTTRHKASDQKIGYKIEYENSGRISSKTRCAREFGTTVILKDIFHTLPVRHREFLKNVKREFYRLMNILYGYCLVVNGVRISCTNQVGNAGPSTVIAVPAYSSMRERIAALFGAKQLSSLIEIKQCTQVPEEILTEFGLTEKLYERKYELEGYISAPNKGRSSNDRQFFFINSRPCDPVKISRVVNEAYHSFSRHQSPFICLHIMTKRENVDVNVTPDKRTLYVQSEKILLATIKSTLLPLLSTAASTFTSVNTQSSQLNFTGQLSQPESSNLCVTTTNLDENEDCENVNDSITGFDPQRSTASCSSKSQNFSKSNYAGTSGFSMSSGGRKTISDFTAPYKRTRDYNSSSHSVTEQRQRPKLLSCLDKYKVTRTGTFGKKDDDGTCKVNDHGNEVEEEDSKTEGRLYFRGGCATTIREFEEDDSEIMDTDYVTLQDDDNDVEIVVYDDELESEQNYTGAQDRKKVEVTVDWKAISLKLTAMSKKNATGSSTISYARRFRAKISPGDNSTAEEELKKQLSKDMFCQMEIIGQFNLGFIIAKNGPDLFIVDQHASDEKYNYEDLEKTMVLQGQPLICPLDLQLPAISENIIVDNVEVFQRNGFDFIISPDDVPTNRVKLSKIPYSKNTEFGKRDIEELIFMLEDAPEKAFYRPTKVREMLASRACRKSVMVGKALSAKEMRTILDHMGDMEQPWNCPHGRPTIRHLINLNILPDVDQTRFNH